MKKILTAALAALFIASLFGIPASAQQQDPEKLKDMKVMDSQGKELGEIDEVIVGTDGKVEAVIIEKGGFLGIGEKEQRISWSELRMAENQDYLVHSPGQATQEQARTGAAQQQAQTESSQQQAQAGSSQQAQAGSRQQQQQAGIERSRQIADPHKQMVGMVALDDKGEELGTIQEVTSSEQGDAVFVVISGQDEKLYPVQIQQLKIYGEEANKVQAAFGKDKMMQGPSFSRDQWQQISAREWQSEVRTYYGQGQSQREQGQAQQQASAARDGQQQTQMEREQQQTASAGSDQQQQQAQMQKGTQQQQTQAARGDQQQAGGQITVQQPAPKVQVQPSQPRVQVEQKPPQVIVKQQPPKVTVEQQPPQVEVKQPKPEVSVQQQKPEVQVQQQKPEVTVQKAEPQVQIKESGQSQVQIEKQGQPQVQVTRQDQPRGETAQAQSQDRQQAADQSRQQKSFAQIKADEAKDLLNQKVTGKDNEELGTVKTYYLSDDNQNILYVIVADEENNLHPIPAAMVQQDQNRLTAPIDRNAFAQSPSFKEGERPELDKGQWSQEIRSYYEKMEGGGQGSR